LIVDQILSATVTDLSKKVTCQTYKIEKANSNLDRAQLILGNKIFLSKFSNHISAVQNQDFSQDEILIEEAADLDLQTLVDYTATAAQRNLEEDTINQMITEVVGNCMKDVSDDAVTIAQRNLEEDTINQMITEVVGNCMKDVRNKRKVNK